jgi:hypothetical protein
VRHPRDHRRGDGPLAKGETNLAAGLPGEDGALGKGVLLLADRQFVDANLWRQAAATGAQLLWRTRSNAVLPVLETFGDGSYLSQIAAATDRRRGAGPDRGPGGGVHPRQGPGPPSAGRPRTGC